MKSRTQFKQETGYTLIELMVGLLVGLIVLSAVIYMFLTTFSSSRDVFNSTKLNQELSTLNDLMAGELKRAGFWPAASGAVTSPFSLDPADASAEEALRIPSSTCVLYTYDADGDQVIDNSERLGFRLVGSGAIGVIEARVSGAEATDCSDSNSTWSAVTDESFMNVSEFNVVEDSICLFSDGTASMACAAAPSTGYVSVRGIEIHVKANVIADPRWEATFDDKVKVRNNKVIE